MNADTVWRQYHYVQTLIDNDVPDAEILAAIKAIRQVDAENEDETEGLRDLTAAEQRMRTWCVERGLDYDGLSEDQIAELADEAVATWRQSWRRRE